MFSLEFRIQFIHVIRWLYLECNPFLVLIQEVGLDLTKKVISLHLLLLRTD